MNIEELKNKLKINKNGYYDNKSYIFDLETSDEFSKIYTYLDNQDWLIPNYDVIQINEDSTLVNYDVDQFNISLHANFNDNDYKLVIYEGDDNGKK